jgi:DNA-binding response OmpR family regulator
VRVTRIGPNNHSNGKPFVYDELLPRMRAVLRRAAGPHHPRLEIRDLDIDLASRVVKRATAARVSSRSRRLSSCRRRSASAVAFSAFLAR